jgi:hypothetical protein
MSRLSPVSLYWWTLGALLVAATAVAGLAIAVA